MLWLKTGFLRMSQITRLALLRLPQLLGGGFPTKGSYAGRSALESLAKPVFLVLVAIIMNIYGSDFLDMFRLLINP